MQDGHVQRRAAKKVFQGKQLPQDERVERHALPNVS
jgi:hypothetical protein